METNELKMAIKKVLPATKSSSEETVPGAKMIIIVYDQVLAFNDTLCISAPIPDSELVCAVNAKDLQKIVSGIKDKELTLEVKDKTLHITSEKTSAELAIFSPDAVLNIVESLEMTEMHPLPVDFTDGVTLCQDSVSSDYAQNLNLFAMKFKNEHIYSADPFRISHYVLQESLNCQFLLPKAVLKPLVNFNAELFCFNNGWVHFENKDGDLLSCRAINGDLPDLEALLKTFDEEPQILSLPDELRDVLTDMIGVYDTTEEYNKHVLIEIVPGLMTLSFKKERASLKKKIKIAEQNVFCNISLSAVFLLNIIDIIFEMKIGEKQVVFQNEDFTHMIMLGRL